MACLVNGTNFLLKAGSTAVAAAARARAHACARVFWLSFLSWGGGAAVAHELPSAPAPGSVALLAAWWARAGPTQSAGTMAALLGGPSPPPAAARRPSSTRSSCLRTRPRTLCPQEVRRWPGAAKGGAGGRTLRKAPALQMPRPHASYQQDTSGPAATTTSRRPLAQCTRALHTRAPPRATCARACVCRRACTQLTAPATCTPSCW